MLLLRWDGGKSAIRLIYFQISGHSTNALLQPWCRTVYGLRCTRWILWLSSVDVLYGIRLLRVPNQELWRYWL